MKIVQNAQRVTVCEKSEFQEICKNDYENYNQTIELEPMLLHNNDNSVKKKYENIVNTMKIWCENKTSKHPKGYVLTGSTITDICLRLYYGKIDREEKLDDLGRLFNIEEFPGEYTITVYNPVERVILLIREAKDKNVLNELKLCSVELKMLMMLLGNELKNSGIKVIPLVVTDEEVVCTPCKKHLISKVAIEQIELFIKWFEQKSVDYDITIRDFLNDESKNYEDRSKDVARKLISCMSLRNVDDLFPALGIDNQMKGALLLLTPEQRDILCSEDKHVIINGPYGSGKSIIAAIKAQKLADDLQANELLYYITDDSMTDHSLSYTIASKNKKIEIYPNTEEKKRMKISGKIKDILKINMQIDVKEEQNRKKINLIIDEYNGERLDEKEAENIKKIIYTEYPKVFEDAVIMLVNQSMKKEREYDGFYEVDGNRFDILEEKMKIKKLTIVMRNSVQIFSLLQETQEFLKEEKTSYQLPKKQDDESQRKPQNDNKSQKKSLIKKPIRPYSLLDDLGTSSKSSMENSRVYDSEIDEAIAYINSPLSAEEGDGIILESYFKYDIARGIGHNVLFDKPKLFELERSMDEFQKILALTVIFETLNIAKSNANHKHVVLHLKNDDEIPRRAFKLLKYKHRSKRSYVKVNDKVTDAYEQFKDDATGKYIFVCNFRKFRGLEHSNITLVIDDNIEALRHYLVECIARCTTQLNIVVLGSNKILTNITDKWKDKNKKLVTQWKIEFDKIGKMKIEELFEIKKDGIIKIFQSSKCYEDMEREYKNKLVDERGLSANLKQSLEEQLRR